jgi:cytochrome c-type biogenesis protein CcmH
MRFMLFAQMVLVFIIALAPPANAVNPSEILADKVLEARARDISKELRCVVCQNQSIDDSDASLARDLRVLVRDRLTAGDSDQQVIDYVVSRYGDFVLLRPPVKGVTYVLWFSPILLALIGLTGLILYYRRQKAPVVVAATVQTPLSEDEIKRLDALLKRDSET